MWERWTRRSTAASVMAPSRARSRRAAWSFCTRLARRRRDEPPTGGEAGFWRSSLCLDLPIPAAMHALGLQDGSRRPMVFQRTQDGLGITTRLPSAEAWAVGRCIRHHSDTTWRGISCDLDRRDALERVAEAVDGILVAAPNLVIVRRRTGHAAVAWFLHELVHKYPGARDAPSGCSAGPSSIIGTCSGEIPGTTGRPSATPWLLACALASGSSSTWARTPIRSPEGSRITSPADGGSPAS